MVTLDDVLNYLGIDYDDEMVIANVKRTISTAKAWMKGAIGENFPEDDFRVKELMLIVIGDLYDNRGMHDKVSGGVRKLVSDFALQLRLEMRDSDDDV